MQTELDVILSSSKQSAKQLFFVRGYVKVRESGKIHKYDMTLNITHL